MCKSMTNNNFFAKKNFVDLYAYDGMTETAVLRIDIYGIIIETVVARSTLSSSANILSYVHYF